jgi:hypothetical protein
MPKVDWREIDKAARRLAKEWEKTPAYAEELLLAVQIEQRRRIGPPSAAVLPPTPVVLNVYAQWMSCFGLDNALKAAQLLIEILEVKRLVKAKETILASGIKHQADQSEGQRGEP